MKISVVTAVFNRVDTISDTIASVRSQSYENVEHIIQDGQSTDGTVERINTIAPDQTVLVSEPDSGIYDAINRGMRRASGEVIGLMHSDDLFSCNAVLSRVASAFQTPEVDGVYGDLVYVSANDKDKVIRYWCAGEYSFSKLRRGWMPPHPTLYLRRGIYEKWGLYDTRFRIAADYDAMLRYLVRGRIRLAYIPEVLVKMRVGGESNRSLERIIKKSREDYYAIRQNDIGGMGTLINKNLSKLGQFWNRE